MKSSDDILLVGGFQEMIELCEESGLNIVGIIDREVGGGKFSYPVIGSDDDALELFKQYGHCKIVITPDSPTLRHKLFSLYNEIGYDFATIVSPRASVSKSAIVGKGTVIQAGVNISSNTVIGNFVKINTNANVMHDNQVGDYTTIAPNAVLLGRVTVGEEAYIGSNSTILPERDIGKRATIGAGAVVTHHVRAGTIVKGVPAK